MKIDSLVQKVSDIESELKKISETYVIDKTDAIVLSTMGAFLALSIAEFPRWISFVGLAALMGKCYHVFYKWKNAKNELGTIQQAITRNLSDLIKICREMAAEAQKEITADPTENLPQNISYIIKPLQRLENTALAFGKEYHGIVHDEIVRVLQEYRLEFLNYDENTKDCYDTETADIDEITYASVAVVKQKRSRNDRDIVLKGKVFIPKNK